MEKKLEINEAFVDAMHQYLSIAGMNDVVLGLKKQCNEDKIQLKPVSKQKLVKRENIVAHEKALMSHLEKDECGKFFDRWNELFTACSKSAEVLSLEFHIRLYFATFPLRKSPPNQNDYQERIKELKKFLENGGGVKYSYDVQLMQYFALPYVAEPKKHPVFKELVHKKWAKSIQDKLSAFLTKRTTSMNEAQDDLLQKWMTTFQSHYDKLLEEKYCELRHDYYHIVEIIDEIIGFLEQLNQGKEAIQLSTGCLTGIKAQLADVKAIAEKYVQKSFTEKKWCRKEKEEHDCDGKNTINMMREHFDDEWSGNVKEVVMDNLVAQLNYAKIWNCLMKRSCGRFESLLLQALRQRITRTSIRSAKQVLAVYATNDLLQLKKMKNSVVSAITSQDDASNEAKEELCRLLNSIASFINGRNYLLANGQGKHLITTLIIALKNKKLQNHAGEHVIGTLQKLSIRRTVQKELVQLGMVEWLSLYLAGTKPSAAAIDYGCALLLNLCLNPLSRSAFSRASPTFVEAMANLMSDDRLQVCSYINGLLYLVLGVARVKAKAKEVNLASIVKKKLESHHCRDDEIQLPIIYKILLGGND